MPRRRFITILCLAAAVLAGGAFIYVALNRRTPEPTFQGRSASYWLRAVFRGSQQRQALDAFRQMGTNADSVLVAAIEAREGIYSRILRRVYPRLPTVIHRHLPPPEDLQELRSAAGFVVLNTSLIDIVPKLLPLLEEPDSELRLAVLQTVSNRIGPPDASQISFLLLAANDSSPKVRAMALLCLSRMGRSATSAEPIALKLCADSDTGVRTYAASTLWKITGQTNKAVPVLEGVLDDLGRKHDATNSHWVACYLLEMGESDSSLVPIFINSLTNIHLRTGERMSACSCLGRIGPPAAAAIPALREALQDPDAEVRRRANAALSRIDPKRAVTHSPSAAGSLRGLSSPPVE
jgi:HEAT repeat protein